MWVRDLHAAWTTELERARTKSLTQLASTLFVTPNTLKTHLRAIYRKLGAESRGEAVIRARERGLI